jgi:hypothetical protein
VWMGTNGRRPAVNKVKGRERELCCPSPRLECMGIMGSKRQDCRFNIMGNYDGGNGVCGPTGKTVCWIDRYDWSFATLTPEE